MQKFVFKIFYLIVSLINFSLNQFLAEDESLKFLYEKNYEAQKLKFSGSPLDGLIPGIGYSTDTQSIGKAVCFLTDKIIKSGQSSILKFEEALDLKSILQTFNLEVDISGGWGIFSTNDMFKYFKSLEENSYTLSINYFQKVSDTNIMTYSYDPDNILTTIGKNIYKNNTNPMFRLLCGDTLISSYEEGATLVISLKIIFNSKEEKEQFDAKIGIKIGSFIDATTTISQYSSQYNLNGKIEITGFQLGGDPSQLSKLLSSSVVDCDIENTQACQETAKNLINYVSNIFPTQFKKDESGIWTSPLVPISQFKKDYLLSDIGFELSPSYITKEIESKRNDLIKIFKKNDYYKKNFDYIIKNYPVPIEDTFTKLDNVLIRNNYILLNGNEYGNKALDCFEFPFKCLDSYNALLANIDTEIDTKIEKMLSDFSFVTSFSTNLYYTKCLPPNWEWKFVIDLNMRVYPVGNGYYGLYTYSNYMLITDQSTNNLGKFAYVATQDIFTWNMFVDTNKIDDKTFKGIFRCQGKNFSLDQSYELSGGILLNPFYFAPYN